MEEPIIELNDVSMAFRIARRHYGLKNIVLHAVQYIKDMREAATYSALDHVNIKINRGERVGLVGHNGCGKTTTLSIIGGVYKRYKGEVKVRGRVSMMLALGAGFCPELSGRENIILNGVLQGRTREEMEALTPDIIDFADIGPFIDSPVFTYSSGMQARLGFGIVTAIEPEILLVDEVMAVGDADFAAKCEKRIEKLLANGTTLVLVSHNSEDIKKYCNRVIRLDHGHIVYDGPTEGSGIRIEEARVDATPLEPAYKVYNGAISEDKTKPYCIFVAHDSSPFSRQIHSMNVLKELSRKFNVLMIFLHTRGSHNDFFIAHSWRYVAVDPSIEGQSDQLSTILCEITEDRKYDFAVANSVMTRSILKGLKENRIRSVLCIHEFAQYIAGSLFEECFEYGDEIVFSSQATLDAALKRRCILGKPHFSIIPQGKSAPVTDSSRANEEQENAMIKTIEVYKDKGVCVVLGVGTVEYRKGFDLFLGVAAKLKAQNPNRRFKFLWAGNRFDPEIDFMSKFYAAEIEMLGLEDDLEYLGWVSSTNRLYELADIYLLTSVLDPLPGTVIEAMSHKLPVICFDKASGFPEMFEEAGFAEKCVARFMDVEHMTALATKLITDEAAHNALANEQFALYEKNFDMPTYVDKLIELGHPKA